MNEGNSYRQILRSSSIIGGASVINILVGLLRTKVAAMLLGPAGVGLIGLYTNVVAVAANVAGLGFGNVGTRQIAEVTGQDDSQRIAAARRALFWGTLVLAVLGAVALWLLRDAVALHLLGDAALTDEVGWLALALALTVAAASQNALLNGLRRIGDIARVSIGTALLSTLIGVLALWWLGRAGLIAFVIAGPLASFLLGHFYVARLPKVQGPPTPLSELSAQWRTLARLGAAFMVAGLAGTVGQLVVRSLVKQGLGVEALGLFQASWAISMTYIGFVLTAMGTDYYPRLTAVIKDHAAVNRLVNEQTEVALLLATPILLLMLALAPWVIRLLYSAEFAGAAEVLRWQVLGDFLKIVSWPLGFILLAAGAGRAFMLTEWIGMGSFVLFAWVGLPLLGITATGVAFLSLYATYLPMVYWLAVRRTGFGWNRPVQRLILVALVVAVGIAGLAQLSDTIAAVIGVPLAVMAGLHGAARLGDMANLGGKLGKLASMSQKAMQRIGFRS